MGGGVKHGNTHGLRVNPEKGIHTTNRNTDVYEAMLVTQVDPRCRHRRVRVRVNPSGLTRRIGEGVRCVVRVNPYHNRIVGLAR